MPVVTQQGINKKSAEQKYCRFADDDICLLFLIPLLDLIDRVYDIILIRPMIDYPKDSLPPCLSLSLSPYTMCQRADDEKHGPKNVGAVYEAATPSLPELKEICWKWLISSPNASSRITRYFSGYTGPYLNRV